MPIPQPDSCLTIRDVFESQQRELAAPLYQRRYAWDRKNLAELWEDIANVEAGTSESLFLGAIILKHDGHSDSTKGTLERFLILDGQQRIATLYLTLLGIALEWQDHGHHDSAAAIAETYLMSTLRRARGKHRFLPTLPDMAEFTSLCRQLDVEWQSIITREGRPGKLTTALGYARSQIQDRCLGEEGFSGDSLSELEKTIVDKTELAVINIANRHQPNEVFDRLNRKGQPLTVGDLVKNEIFRRLGAEVDMATKLYEKHWDPFERSFAEKKLLDNYYYPYTLTVDDGATVSSAFRVLRTHWEFLTADDSDAVAAAELIIEDLQKFVPEYNALTAATDYDVDCAVKQWVDRLVRMSVPRVTYAYLIQLLKEHRTGGLGPEETAECLKTIESFLVRRAFSGLEPTGLHAVFKGLWQKNGGNPLGLAKSLQTRTIQFPDDDKFRRDICFTPFYGRKLDGYVLAELEIATHRTNPLSEEQLTSITVDHIAPQTLKEEWLETFSMDHGERLRLLNLLGNLVPLSRPDNSTKGSRGWQEARELLRHETIYRSTREVLGKYSHWGPDEIRDRTEELAEVCIQRWPGP